MTRADLVVIGGGPAGAAIAALAVTRGAKTLLVEKERFPRDKVCGEFLSAEGCAVLARFGLLPILAENGAMPMDACLLADGKGRSATAPLPDLPHAGRTGLGISRKVLDELLLNHAASRGVTVRERTVAVRPLLDDGLVTGIVTRESGGTGGDEAIGASLVLAADGRRSMLQRALLPGIGDPLTTSPRSWFGFKAHFPDRTGGLSRRIELYVFDGGYAGLAPVEGGRLNLALIARVDALNACGNSPLRLFDERMLANPLLRERLANDRPCSPWKTTGPLRFNVRAPSSHGAMFLGDAAGTIDPFSGEGMTNALKGAELALPFVIDALAAGRLTPAAARAWSYAWRGSFAPVTRRARLIGRIFQHPRPASLAMGLLRLPRGARMLPSLVAATRTGGI
jgi:flavin-dependent dehydrogenase